MPGDFIKNHHGINIKYPTSDQDKDTQKINDSIAALNKAKAKIRQNLIASDNRAATYTAITQFKKTNG